MNDWHLVHYGGLAKGGAALVIFEASGVQDIGRITPHCAGIPLSANTQSSLATLTINTHMCDAGIWKDEHIAPLKRIVDFIHQHGSLAGLQIAHAGRKVF